MEPKMQTKDAANFLGITLPGIHKQIKTKNIVVGKKQNKVYICHESARKLFNLKINPTVIACELVKGGVGKTSVSLSCAIRATLYGLKVAIIDIDQQGNLTRACRVNAENHPAMIDIINENLKIEDFLINVVPGLDILPSRFENAMLNSTLMINTFPLNTIFKDKLTSLKEKYDLIFIDCPPDLGASVAAAALASDFIMAPVEPDDFSILGLNVTLREIYKIEKKFKTKIPIKIVLNKFSSKTTLSHKVLANLVNSEQTRNLLFRTFIRLSQEFPNTYDRGASLFDSLKDSPAKEDIDLLTREIIELIQNKETSTNKIESNIEMKERLEGAI